MAVLDLLGNPEDRVSRDMAHISGAGCSKLMTSSINVSLKFET